MRKIKYLIFIAVISVFFTGMSVYADNTEDKPQFDDSTVLVIMKPKSNGIRLYSAQSTANSAYSVFDELGITDIETIATISSEAKGGISLFSVSAVNGDKDILKLTLPEGGEESVLAAVETLNESGTVEYAQPDFYYYTDTGYTPDDTYYSEQYNLKKINAQYVWDMDIDCSDVTVAVLDTGMLITHEDLAANLWTDSDGTTHGWDFSSDTGTITDPLGHGTHVSGIISAETNNSVGVASLARNAKIASLKVFGTKIENETTIFYSNSSLIVKALEYVREKKFPIANCSWGATGFNEGDITDETVKELFKSCSDTLFTVAAGNSDMNNDDNEYYPATFGFDNIISVAATDENDELAKFYDENNSYIGASNYGEKTVDIAAPGKGIWSTYNKDGIYASMQGTSQAAPLVASAAAVVKAKYPSLTPAQIKQAILEGADTVSELDGKVNGARRLNAYKALMYAGSPYTITWKNEDGSVIDTTDVEYGETPTHTDAAKANTAEYTYTFAGWTPAVTAVTGDAEYTASFNQTKNSYTITWKNEDGSVIDTTTVEYGELPLHDDAVKQDDDTYSYLFTGWQPEIETVKEETSYTAQFIGIKKAVPVYELNIAEKYSDILMINASVSGEGDIVISAEPKDTDVSLPQICAYIAVYNNDELEKIIRQEFISSNAVLEFASDKQCKLFIWTEQNEPVTMTVNDIAAFMNTPSQ